MSGQYDTIILFLLVLIFVKLFFPRFVSGFTGKAFRPYEYDVTGTGKEPGDFFKLPVDMKCTPGPSKDADYYTTETAGGICGGGQFVNQQMKNYKIM
jgi:hypothetical protein